MEETRETEVARRSLLFNPACPTYRYWRELTGEIIAETKGVIARSGWTRREAAALLLADQLETDIVGDSDVLVSDVGIYQELVHTALDNVDWWSLAEALIDEHAVRAPNTATPPENHATARYCRRLHPRSYTKTA
jgi:hypothetical protein